MSAPKISVLIPSHNAARYIGETLESVYRQTWTNLEVIVVDDASRDESVAEAERFTAHGLKIVRQQKRGASAARNRAYAESSGALVQFLDADDILDPEKLSVQMARLSDAPGCVASAEWGRFYASPEDTKFEPEPVWADLNPVDWLALSRSKGQGMLFPALWLIPREIATAAGPWNEELSRGDDTEYFTRLILAARKVLFCPGARCHYRSGVSGSLSGRSSPAAWASEFKVIELCQAHVLAREDSDRTRCGFALSWQHLAHAAYPYDPNLAEAALNRARLLHAATIQPSGGQVFRLISSLIGWRTARRLQVASGRP